MRSLSRWGYSPSIIEDRDYNRNIKLNTIKYKLEHTFFKVCGYNVFRFFSIYIQYDRYGYGKVDDFTLRFKVCNSIPDVIKLLFFCIKKKKNEMEWSSGQMNLAQHYIIQFCLY